MKPRSEFIERSFNDSSVEAFQLPIANYKAAHELKNGSLNDDESFSFECLIFHLRNLVEDFFFLYVLLFSGEFNHIFHHLNVCCGGDWDLQNVVKFDFQLKLNPKYPETGELLVVGPGSREIVFNTIYVNDEIKSMDGQIVACRRIDNQSQRLRTDRKHPNARRTVESILYNYTHFIFSINKCI